MQADDCAPIEIARLRRALERAHAREAVIEDGTGRPVQEAAVLVPLVLRDGGMTVLLTQRTDHLHHHPGQISFPGGRVEQGDGSPLAAALRETEEEIGLHPRHVEVIGRLPEYRTVTGFSITPLVGLVHPPFELELDSFEVAEAFEVPLDCSNRATVNATASSTRGCCASTSRCPGKGVSSGVPPPACS